MDTVFQPLYHYTSQKGLLGIVKSNEVWFTDIFYLNDTMEYKYAVDLASKVIKKRQESYKDKPRSYAPLVGPKKNTSSIAPLSQYRYEKKWIEYNMLEDLNSIIKRIKGFHIFVFSLTEKGNTLSQWRGYCPNNNGYSIGFNSTALKQIIKKMPLKLVKCIYKENDQKKRIDKFLGKFIKSIRSDLDNLSNSSKSRLALLVKSSWDFLPIASILKHESFIDEDEWRLISVPIEAGHKSVKFREGVSTTIPYITINLKGEKHIPLEHIYIGPTANEQLSKEAVDSLLKSKDITTCKVDFSGIPYRPLH